jgi:hypothetical protein
MSILLSTLRAIAYTLTNFDMALVLVILAVILYRQNKKTTVMQKMIIGDSLNSAFELTISQVVIGIFAGVLASIAITFLGVAFDGNSAVYLIFLISIFFMFWKPKYICFAYSGAVLGFISLFLELISKVYAGVKLNILGGSINLSDVNVLKVDIGGLMTVVAVLHIIEGLLVMIDGTRGAIPVFTNRDEKIIGGFALRRNWVLPVALFFIISNASSLGATHNVATPDWWPLIKSSPVTRMAKDAAVSLFAYFGVIGYSTVTFTKNKSEKVVSSGIGILLYGIALLAAAQLAPLGYMYQLLVVVFAPLAHEIMLNIQRYMEVNGTPKYMSTEEGIMVLEVAPNSPASEMGIKSGDMLVEVNSRKIEDEHDILSASKQGQGYISFKLRRGLNRFHEVSYNKLNSEKRLGIVFVPKNAPKEDMMTRFDEDKFKEVLDKMKSNDNDDENEE